VTDDMERIKLWVEVLTGTEMDEKGEIWMLGAQTWQKRRDKLKALGGPPLPQRKLVPRK
jgi:hypothetical protein